MQLPSDCPLPLGTYESLPNAERDYRSGVHEGIDFICGEFGRDAVAALDGQVLIANQSYVDPKPSERKELLDIAAQVGHTPPWTLAMLFGRFVVIDHGSRPGVGHVVTIYAHLNEIDPAIVPGHHVATGDRIGEIGNAGTESAGTGEDRPQAIHLHWEIHIDDQFLGHGATGADTSAIYARLFGR
ncbi:MAG: M23 family metallopeptidase [Rhodoblastus sp.]|nr:M23 family metallopeptidase [Rhodoblastus sp.]